MIKNRWVIAVVVVLVAAVVVWIVRNHGTAPPAIDLVAQFPGAEKRPPGASFDVMNVTINGQQKPAIVVHASSRLIYKVTLPNDAWLRTSVALAPAAWTREGDGMQFRIGVSDGRAYEPLYQQHLDPYAEPGDRRWVPVTIDLSAYGGRQVDLIFNTDASLPGKEEDRRNDDGVWGAPGIYLSR